MSAEGDTITYEQRRKRLLICHLLQSPDAKLAMIMKKDFANFSTKDDKDEKDYRTISEVETHLFNVLLNREEL
ncbi:hypothetical protein BRETT_005059 [Brettanomyces bruxellensis]|uniref:Uncharacterized protein n=1 Tax=Dekkera bruxellensis TaxID=5007 RepID=A0A871R210_DEKBR|nr:uncharacterized protein BRETT_005059 [Brettanomyces bruxellensis]QOU20403.1 hypothetical protein BRETT_005059 [Brettanomyces bruxellensis]